MAKALFYRHHTALVEKGAIVGAGTRIWHHAHIRAGADIGRLCNIGKNVYVDRGAIVGNRCKIQNNCSIYEGVILADDVFVGPHVTFTNDKHPRSAGDWIKEATIVGKGVSFGAHATVVCGITIGEYALIGAGAVITHHVEPYTLIYGNPGRPVGFVCERGHPLVRTPFGWMCRSCKKQLKLSYEWKDQR